MDVSHEVELLPTTVVIGDDLHQKKNIRFSMKSVKTSLKVAKHDVRSLDFAVTRFLMKLFRSSNINVIDECRLFFNFMLPSEKIEKKKNRFRE